MPSRQRASKAIDNNFTKELTKQISKITRVAYLQTCSQIGIDKAINKRITSKHIQDTYLYYFKLGILAIAINYSFEMLHIITPKEKSCQVSSNPVSITG
jgi:hypothetical protein